MATATDIKNTKVSRYSYLKHSLNNTNLISSFWEEEHLYHKREGEEESNNMLTF